MSVLRDLLGWDRDQIKPLWKTLHTMFMFQRVFQVIDLGIWQACALEDFDPLFSRLRACYVFDTLLQCLTIRHT